MIPVITSYSIHYTKLYDRFFSEPAVMGLFGFTFRFIFSLTHRKKPFNFGFNLGLTHIGIIKFVLIRYVRFR